MSRNDLYNGSRMFQVWDYTPSHAVLLLRSPKGDGGPRRIDMIFREVAGFCLPTVLHDLKVRASDPGRSESFAKSLLTGSLVLFACYASNLPGWVVAGSFDIREDDLEYYDPTGFPDFSFL